MVTQSDLIMLGLAILIGFVDDYNKPKSYYYQNNIVVVYEKYQCPKYCEVNHPHFVYYNSLTNGMVIDKNTLGKKINKKKISK